MRESDVFDAGADISVFAWEGWQVMSLICFDLRFPELTRKGALAGATLFLVHSAWPHSRRQIFSTLGRARAIENQVFVASSNFVGANASGMRFAGSSAIYGPTGDVLGELGDETEGLLCVDLDTSLVAKARSTLPCYPKRRTDLY